MRASLKILSAILLAALALNARAAHTQASLILAADTARPGDTVLAGIHLRMDEHWHTYWRNPGDSGIATKIAWQLPTGIIAGEIQWPLPEKLTVSKLTTYVYENEVVLLVPLKLAETLPPGPLELKAKVSWLECAELCLPGEQEVSATLNVGAEAKSSADAALIETWRALIPHPDGNARVEAFWTSPPKDDTRPMDIAVMISPPASADFFPNASEHFDVSSASPAGSDRTGTFWLRATVKKYDGDWPKEISGVLVVENNGSRQGSEVKLPVAEPLAATSSPATSPVAAQSKQSLWLMLVFAFIGGLLLNIMPCVLPVIALKILGFVSQANEDPRRVRKLGLIYAAGVLVSFLALAALVIAVQAAGHRASWGMQFSHPTFIVALAALVTLVALNLFGVFEVTPGARVMDAAGKASGKHGVAGAFFNGVLATILATPCTAPFLAGALGYAFTQKASFIVAIFLAAGAGLAAPYVLLSWRPAWLKFLPKPGAWMERFKIAMGFPMLATAVWLYDVASAFYGDRTWWLGIFLVVLALAAWVFGEFVQRGRGGKKFAVVVAVILLLAGYGYALEGQLHWRTALAEMPAVPLKESADGIEWQPWSAGAVAAARAQGRPVLVDFTARWCLTCRANKEFAIEVPAVRVRLKQLNAMALLADYTHFDEAIGAELARFGRAGVPLVLVYPADAGSPPEILPTVLTPQIVLDALNNAAK